MTTAQVLMFLERREKAAGRFARAHWANAIKEIEYAKRMDTEDRLSRTRQTMQERRGR